MIIGYSKAARACKKILLEDLRQIPVPLLKHASPCFGRALREILLRILFHQANAAGGALLHTNAAPDAGIRVVDDLLEIPGAKLFAFLRFRGILPGFQTNGIDGATLFAQSAGNTGFVVVLHPVVGGLVMLPLPPRRQPDGLQKNAAAGAAVADPGCWACGETVTGRLPPPA
jgi:hypothetical protein